MQYRENNVFGNPYLRLVRHEIEALVEERHGDHYLKTKQLKSELAQVNREMRRLKHKWPLLNSEKVNCWRYLVNHSCALPNVSARMTVSQDCATQFQT